MARLDLLLSVIPRLTHDSDPSPGVATINAAAKTAGFSSRCVDFNHILYQSLRSNEPIFFELDRWMAESPTTTLRVNWQRELSQPAQSALQDLLDEYLGVIDFHQPRFFGMGLFSRNSKRLAETLAAHLRQHRPQLKLIVGGAGATPLYEPLRQLVDYYVEGEGEFSIVEILSGRGDQAPGVNGRASLQFEKLDVLPWPDYGDFPLQEYSAKGKKLRITGSRGCTRRCNFCNVYKIWPTYRHRSGASLAAEMLHQHQSLSTQPDHFIFTDSLINGKTQVLREMCEALIQARETSGVQLKFEGQFIAVSDKGLTAEDYKMLAKAGCDRVYVGFESGSEKVRFAMNKKIRDADVDFSVRQLAANKIRMLWYLMVGFGEEREEDFQQTLNLLERFAPLNREGYRIQVTLHEFTPLEEVDWFAQHESQLSKDAQGQWLYAGNPLLTHSERVQRLLRVEEALQRFGYEHWQPSLMEYPKMSLKQVIDQAQMRGTFDQLQHPV